MAGAGRLRSWGGAATTAWQIRVRWGHLMQLNLSDLEIELLRKLVNGEAVSISSQQRVRLELAGMIREGPKGIVVTLTGRNLARPGERQRCRTQCPCLAGPPRSANAFSAQINLLNRSAGARTKPACASAPNGVWCIPRSGSGRTLRNCLHPRPRRRVVRTSAARYPERRRLKVSGVSGKNAP